MKRIIALTCVALFAFAASNSYETAASQSEKTIVLRVKSVDGKPVSFSGWYQSDDSKGSVDVVMRHMRPGIGLKLDTESLKGNFRAESGSPDLFVELIEFTGKMESGSVSGQGRALEFEVQTTDGQSRLAVRPIPGS